MNNWQEFFVVCMTICFALSTSLAFLSVINLQEQLKNDNEVSSIGVSLIDSLGLVQISIGTDRLEEFKQDYIYYRQRYIELEETNHQKNNRLNEDLTTYNFWVFMTFILGILFFILHLRFLKKIKNFFKKAPKTINSIGT